MEQPTNLPPLSKTCILGSFFAVTNMTDVIGRIGINLERWRGDYICAGNVHTTIMGYDDPVFRSAENGAVLLLPDGKPISIIQRLYGYHAAGQVTGPDFLHALFSAPSAREYRHFFYGSTQSTLDRLCENMRDECPHACIVGAIPSVFRDMTEEENDALVAAVNQAQPDILWVGLGAPRQELFMAKNRGRIHALIIGVGGAFASSAGETKRPPKWMQKLCLEWFYRLIQEPKRLFKRYLITNTRFLFLMATQQRKWKNQCR